MAQRGLVRRLFLLTAIVIGCGPSIPPLPRHDRAIVVEGAGNQPCASLCRPGLRVGERMVDCGEASASMGEHWAPEHLSYCLYEKTTARPRSAP